MNVYLKIVLYCFVFTDTPRFLVRPHNQVVAVGRTISLHCSAAGYPQPTIYWETKAQKVCQHTDIYFFVVFFLKIVSSVKYINFYFKKGLWYK